MVVLSAERFSDDIIRKSGGRCQDFLINLFKKSLT